MQLLCTITKKTFTLRERGKGQEIGCCHRLVCGDELDVVVVSLTVWGTLQQNLPLIYLYPMSPAPEKADHSLTHKSRR